MRRPLLIIGCTRRKAATATPVPAFALYQGGVVPRLRDRFGDDPHAWADVRFLSGRHGLVRADCLLLPYDQPLADPDRLRPAVWSALRDDLARGGIPEHVLVVCEPPYLVLLADLLAIPARPAVHWVPDVHDWSAVAELLDGWRC